MPAGIVRRAGRGLHVDHRIGKTEMGKLRESTIPLRRLLPVVAVLFVAASPALGLTLEEAITLALTRNERAAAADEEARAAEARVTAARSFFFPDVTLEGDYTRRSHETSRVVEGRRSVLQRSDGLEGRVTATQTIFDAQAWPLLRQARRARDAARHDATDAKRRLAYETAEAFLAVLNSEQVARAAAQRLALAERNLVEARVRFDAQLVGSNDVTRAELEAASAEREAVRARGAGRTAHLHLGYLLDAEITDSLAVPSDLLARAAEPLEPEAIAASRGAGRRPDLDAARARLAALRAAAREPLMRYFPDLDLTGTAWATNEAGFSGRGEDWSLGLGLHWPLFDGGQREAARSERVALARAAEQNVENLERGIEVDIESARVALESEQASLARADVAVAAARRNAAESAELYRQGLVRALEVVDAGVQLFEAEVERAGAQYALALAFLDLRAALGLDPLATEAER
jgi:outer membrane protein TolC